MTFLEGFEPTGFELRRAEAGDADLVRRVLCLATGWRDDEPGYELPPGHDAYHEDWGRPDDFGVVVFVGMEFVGGAYARRVGPADGTYGFVDPDLWELSLGVEPAYRRQGLGRLLIEALKARSIEKGISGLSLSVELDNPAGKLYDAARFTIVKERDTDLLMAWRGPSSVH
ncbi:MAG: GNAT family N-acetyltransferase [Acidimicrobiales bacterium]|nr:GNAT family N-acetyltransferase [Acidimicrobiales bacterium]